MENKSNPFNNNKNENRNSNNNYDLFKKDSLNNNQNEDISNYNMIFYESKITGNIVVTCWDGNIYLFTPPNIPGLINKKNKEQNILS